MKILAAITRGYFVLTLVACSCKSGAQQKKEIQPGATAPAPATEKAEVKVLPDQEQKAGIGPGHCRVEGMVTAISPEPQATATGICGQTPCRAKVKILKILGYGPAFNQTLTVNQEINAFLNILYNLLRNYYPIWLPLLPGLKVNSTFVADISLLPGEAGNTMPWYQIELYKVE